MPPRIVTLLTDFGLADHFVASMKGVMLGLNPNLTFVDISHLVPRHDIRSGAFTLGQAFGCFPAGTVHLAVVDPGVGTARKALAATAGAQYLVAPDNGLISRVLESEPEARVHEITAEHYFRKPVSATFHGRDVFAPIAAWLTRDIGIEQLGPPLAAPVRLPQPALKRLRENLIQAEVLAVDQFGNVITSLRPEDIATPGGGRRAFRILAAQREISTYRQTFGEGAAGELFVVPGSAGYLEVVVRDGSAASTLNLAAGSAIGVILG
jgi:S-adenosylmethionine hydrolase